MFFTTTPQMHCAACENKIKNNLRFEKGIKNIETSVPNQTVTVKYNADKTTIPFF
nr:heavy-metal-associated domain-containing protein [Segatella copri]